MDNSFILNIIAKLNKTLSKSAIKNDLKTLNNTMYVRVLARLSKTLAKNELKKQLRELNDLYVNVGTKVKTGKNTKAQIQKNIKELQQTISDLEIGIKASKINKDIENVRSRAQKRAQSTPISFNVEIGKSKLIADIEYLGKRYSKLFSNVSASNKYENILNHAYNASDQKQIADTKAELAAFTSELKANGLATQSVRDKWGKLIDRAKELFSAASIIRTIFVQVKQSVSTFLELDTAMTNLYKVQEDILSRDQFSGLLTKWNKLAQKLAVTTTSLINSAAKWSKMGFNLDTSEQLAQITAIFEKTAEITNEKATSTLISAAQAFTEIDDDYVKRVEAIGNKINAIGNKYSIDSEGIADGLQNASAALKVAGNDLNDTIALLTATNKIFQSPEEGSNMLKVASMRLRGQVDALKEMGEDAEGVSTDLTKIQQQIYELTGNKVNIFEDDENLKSTYQMILEIGEVFDKLGDRQQAELLEVMFGKQRASAGASLLLNYQELEQIKNDSMNAANSMAEEYSKYMESAEAHITIFKEKLTETYSTFMSGDLIKYTADVGSALLDLVNSTDLLKHGLIAITTLKVGQGISSFGAVIASTVTQMNTLGSAIQQVKNLPLDDILRKSELNELGDSTKNLTEKNLKLLLSQKQLNDNDKVTILSMHKLTEEEALAKLEKMGLTDATKKNTTANIVNATSVNVSSVAFKGLAASIRNVWAAMSLLQKASIILAAVSTAWSIASKFVDNYNQKAEKARERTSKLFDEFKNLNNTLADHKKTVAELADRYDELANGVNLSNNKNKTLSTDEYEEFLKINKQLADSFPSLSKGIDENGNSILSLGTKGITAKEQLEELLKTEEDLNNFRISESIDEAFSGILTYVKEAEQASENLKNSLSETNKEISALQEYLDNGIHLNQDHYLLFEVDLTDRAKTNYMFAMQSAANEFYDSLNQDRKFELMGHEIFGASSLLYQTTWGGETEGFYANLLSLDPEKEIPELERLIGEYVKTLKGALADQFDSQRQGFQEQIYRAKNEWTDFLPYYISAMKSKSTFKNLDSDMQDIAVKIVEGLDYSLANEFKKYDPTSSYSYIRDKLIVPLGDLSEDNKQLVKDNFNKLFTLDSDDISQNNQEQIDQIIKDIAAILEKDPIEIRAILGFDVDISEAQKNYQESLDRAKRKFSGYEYDDRGFQTNISNELGKVVDEFYEANVKTQDDIALWERVTADIYDATEAMEAYIEAKNLSDSDENPSLFTQLNNSKDSLDKFQSSVKSASDAYATLLSGNYSSADLLDSIQIINQAVSDMKGTLDWEEIGSLDELQDKLEDVSRSYAESILSGTGIDIESDFGKMLTDIIQQMYEVEAKFTGMNAQFDRLQASYSTLTDAIEYYNETGFINLDTLQSLLTADENLIKMLEVENGQLVINQEAYEELVAVQLLEFKEKLDNAAAAEIEALALSKAEEATNNNAQASEDAVAKLDAETEAFKRNTEAASENAITKAIANAEDAGVSEEEIQNILDKYDEVWNAAINNYHKDFPTFMLGRDKSGSGSGSGSSSSSKDFEETFDWIETAIDRIERSISNLDLKASSVYRSWSERNSNLKAELLDVKKEMDIQASGYNRYMQQANSVGLSEEWASKVRNGQIDINSITDKALAERIKEYQSWYRNMPLYLVTGGGILFNC